jgi:putative membrane protein
MFHRMIANAVSAVGRIGSGFRSAVGPVFLIFSRDVHTIFTNTATFIIALGLCILPSLYAWINIYACWDPYSNTGNLPVAIINNDQGAVFSGKTVNVGNSVVEELKKNKSIGWDFVDDWQGNYGLNEGRYYALIEIPSNFSSGLVSLTSSSPQKPTIVYRVNEKLNAIADKITNVAKEQLVSQIQANFVKTVNEEAVQIVKKETEQTGGLSRLTELKSTLSETDANLTKLQQYIAQANTQSQAFQSALSQISAELPTVTDQIGNIQGAIGAGKSLTQRTQQTVQSINSDLSGDIVQFQALDSQNQTLISQLKSINSNTVPSDVAGTMRQTENICSTVHSMLKADMKNIKTLNEVAQLNTLSFLYDSMKYLDQLVQNEETTLQKLQPLVLAGDPKSAVAQELDDLSQLSTQISSQVSTVSRSFYSQNSKLIDALTLNLTTQMDDTNAILEAVKDLVPQLKALAVFGQANSRLSVEQADKLSSGLSDLQKNLTKVLGKLAQISDDDIKALENIVVNHPEEVADFLSSPLNVKEEEIFSGGTFGEGLTPFYTTLAIWVGALLACALLTVECSSSLRGAHLNLVQRHFGKMLLFLALSFLQSAVIVLGDVFLLGVKPVNLGLMLAFAALCSLTFTIMIFTLVSLFGNVGKAIAVVIMVFQIAGAGGIYPIQTNPKIFGILEPLWPFTYAINGFREAIAGPVWSSVHQNVLALLGFAGAYLLMAVLKKPFHLANTVLERKFKEAEL